MSEMRCSGGFWTYFGGLRHRTICYSSSTLMLVSNTARARAMRYPKVEAGLMSRQYQERLTDLLRVAGQVNNVDPITVPGRSPLSL